MAKPKPRRARRPAPRLKRAAAKTKSSSELSISLDVKALGLEAILGAAYLMMDRAYVFLAGDKTERVTVALRAKSGGGGAAALEGAFRAELEAQKLRWAVAKNNQGVREYVAENALALAEEFSARASAPEPAGDQLSESQRAEIERLIAEVETEIAQMNSKQEHADPKKVSLSWEASREGGAPE